MSHLTKEQRYTICSMKLQGYSQKDIAQTIGKDKSVISRELQRNRDQRSGVYNHDLAQRKYIKRQSYKKKPRIFNSDMAQYVSDKLCQDLSPEQIVGAAKKEGKQCVSHERIYQYIWKDKRKKGELHLHLRNKGRRYKQRGSSKDNRGVIRNRQDISLRPAEVEQRNRFGDLEVDLIIGKNHKSAILTIVDRATGMGKLKRLQSKDAKQLADKAIDCLQEWKPYLKTITSDNGKEFAEHQRIAKKLNIEFFFAEPYSSWQRGSNENYNRLVRQYIPKKSNFDDFSDNEIERIELKLNNRPRKRFNFYTPIDMFNQKVAFCS